MKYKKILLTLLLGVGLFMLFPTEEKAVDVTVDQITGSSKGSVTCGSNYCISHVKVKSGRVFGVKFTLYNNDKKEVKTTKIWDSSRYAGNVSTKYDYPKGKEYNENEDGLAYKFDKFFNQMSSKNDPDATIAKAILKKMGYNLDEVSGYFLIAEPMFGLHYNLGDEKGNFYGTAIEIMEKMNEKGKSWPYGCFEAFMIQPCINKKTDEKTCIANGCSIDGPWNVLNNYFTRIQIGTTFANYKNQSSKSNAKGYYDIRESTTHGKVLIKLSDYQSKKGCIQIKKTNEKGELLSGAKFEIHEKNGRVVKKNISAGLSGEIELVPGKYQIVETTFPNNYTSIDSDITDITVRASNECKVIQIKNKLTDIGKCNEGLKEIFKNGGASYIRTDYNIDKYEITTLTDDQKLKLIELYFDQGEKYNDLLLFEKGYVACSYTPVETSINSNCNDKLKFQFAPKDIKSGSYFVIEENNKKSGFSLGKYASYGKSGTQENSFWGTIRDNNKKSTAFCHINDFSINSKKIGDKENGEKVSVTKGTTVWKNDNNEDIMADGKLEITCDYYGEDSSSVEDEINKKFRSLENNINGGFIKLISQYYNAGTTKISSSIESLESNPSFKSKKYTINFDFKYPERICYAVGSGGFVLKKSCSDNYVDGGYGFPTNPTAQGKDLGYEFTIDISKIEDLKNYYGTSVLSDASTSCKYSTTQGPPPDDGDTPGTNSKKLNLEFRSIDTTKKWEGAFPGIDGGGRKTGSNWNETDDEKIITTNNNSYNRTGKSVISLTLTPSDIKKIKNNYNSNNSGYATKFTCENGGKCKTEFVSKLLNNEYGNVKTSCETGSNRKYCVGGAS